MAKDAGEEPGGTPERDDDEAFLALEDAPDTSASTRAKKRQRSEAPPWMRPESFVASNPVLSLSNEMLDLCDMLAPTAVEQRDCELVVEFVRELVADCLGAEASVHIFGSLLTGLALPSSDVDLAVLDAPDNAIEVLGGSIRRQGNLGLVHEVEVLSSAKVPIIKFIHSDTGRACDICFNNSGGLKTGMYARDLMQKMPQVRALTMVMKHFLGQRHLNDTYSGGIGSFLLQLMVVSLIQTSWRQDAEYERTPTVSLGVLLITFLELYGIKLNTYTTGISVRNGGCFFRKRDQQWLDSSRPFALSVENPEDPSLDVGKNSYQFVKCRRVMEESYERLCAALMKPQPSSKPVSYLGSIIAVDDLILARSIPSSPTFLGKNYDLEVEPLDKGEKKKRKRKAERDLVSSQEEEEDSRKREKKR
ncbi:unnamed protein product [Chrysoparadoxa australica]